MAALDRYFLEYGAFHGDARNEVTHLIGIPAIVLALLMWAGRLKLGVMGAVDVDLGWILVAAVTLFYLVLSVPLGLAGGCALAALHLVGKLALGGNAWLALGLFVVGWLLQFLGHHYEGQRPAFLKNGLHLLIGPLWILSRILERIGLPLRRDAS